MECLVMNILFVAFILSIFWESSDSFDLNHSIPAKYDNRTLARLRRQTTEETTEKPCHRDLTKFQCATETECVDSDKACDGHADCPDGSDEADTLCDRFSCPDYLFTCGYGACVSKDARCDGRRDCNDNSDELDCKPKGSGVPVGVPVPSRYPGSSGLTCITPDQPDNGEWILLSNGEKGYPNTRIDANSVIKYTCRAGYKISATDEASLPVLCLPTGQWSVTTPPVCQRLCPSLYNTPLITLSCNIYDPTTFIFNSVPCDKATDGTILTSQCAPFYEPPHGRAQSSTCYDGSWDYTPECIPVCGEKIVSATVLIVNGTDVERGHYPWVVALYSSRETDPYFTNICGASLITTDIVLTAAHCVTKKETGSKYKAKYFRVGAGKYYNQYQDPRDKDTAQYAEVSVIETHREYRGEIQNFRGDIALLRLKTVLILSTVVQPVCFNNLPTIEPNTIGLVTGWGYTISSGEPSDTLKELELPYNPDEQCLRDLDEDFSHRYFTTDKLCAGFNDQRTSVCKGDSGGGLVFRNPYYKRRYFIHGIVSLAHSYTDNQKQHCNIQRSALFTKVETYIGWIQLKVRQWTVKINVESG